MSEVRIKDITAVFTVDSQPTQASGFVSPPSSPSPSPQILLASSYRVLFGPKPAPQPPRAGTYVGGEDQGHHRRLHRRLAADPSFRFRFPLSLLFSPKSRPLLTGCYLALSQHHNRPEQALMSEVRIKDITAVFTVDLQPTHASGFVSLFLTLFLSPNLRPLLTGCYLALSQHHNRPEQALMSEVRIKDITAVFTVDSQPTQASGFVSPPLLPLLPQISASSYRVLFGPKPAPQPPRAGIYVGGEDQGHHRRLHRRLAADPSFRFPLFPSLFSSPPNLGLFLQGVIWP